MMNVRRSLKKSNTLIYTTYTFSELETAFDMIHDSKLQQKHAKTKLSVFMLCSDMQNQLYHLNACDWDIKKARKTYQPN